MELKDWEKRKNELERYKDTFSDEAAAAKSDYVVLGGKNYPIIIAAISRVFDKLAVKYQEFITSEEFLNSKEEQEVYKQSPTETLCLFSTYFLIELLKKDRYLREKLGEAEENKLYDEFYIYDDNGNCSYNIYTVLTLCLNHVHIKSANTKMFYPCPKKQILQ